MTGTTLFPPPAAPEGFTLDAALAYAEFAHRHDERAGGEPHFEHAVRVMENTREVLALFAPETVSPEEIEEILIFAVLHYVVEHHRTTGVTEEVLRAHWPRDRLVRRVVRLSGRPEGATYNENIQAIVREGDLAVIVVKYADNFDNSDPEQIANLPPERQGIVMRYRRSMKILHEAIIEQLDRSPHRADPLPSSLLMRKIR